MFEIIFVTASLILLASYAAIYVLVDIQTERYNDQYHEHII